MTKPVPIPPARFATDRAFQDEVRNRPDALVYFLCNVGDGDAQVLLLPQGEGGSRQVAIVDAAINDKVPNLLDLLVQEQLVSLQPGPGGAEPIVLAVATHPHQDHIGGMPQVLDRFGPLIAEFWDPGYFHTITAYHGIMQRVEALPQLVYAHPTSGLRRWIGDVAITVLAPSVHLRNRFDSYGVEINDSSISLHVQFPIHRYLIEQEEGQPIPRVKSRSMVLGADAQTLSWAYAIADFPFLRQSDTPAAKAIAAATGDQDLLAADVLKVSHHASKHGVNLELVERVSPSVTLVSSVPEMGKYNFPHAVAQDIIREGLDPSTGDGHAHAPDYDMKIFYTADALDQNPPAALGTIGVVIGLDGITLWRFGDEPGDDVALANARRWNTPIR